MKTKVEKIWILPTLLFAVAAHAGDPSDFDALWRDVSERSHGVLAEKSEYEAADIGVSRANRHWVPRLLVNAQAMSTNSPSNTLFSTLSSRSLLASDLSPGVMNEPPRQWFKQGGVTLDWALFEGGSRVSVSRGAVLESESRALALQSQVNEEYARLAQDYTKLMALHSEAAAYQDLKDKLQGLLSRYKLGSKDNPVGYSGLLGMRALLNRLDGSLAQASAEISALQTSIQTRSGREGKVIRVSERENPMAFIEAKLATEKPTSGGSSLRAESMRLGAEAHAEYAKAERARWLPKVGLVASGNLISGPRDSGTSTEYGAYLQWELFNAGNIGIQKQSSFRATASQERANEMEQNTQISREALSKALPMLRENLKRIEDSIGLTAEQSIVTEKLFRNGSINALQFAEVLSRRTDVVQSKRQVEYAYIDAMAAQYVQNVSKK